ncbi:MAG: hypothetical protein ACLPWG_03235, partial [Steroidobacteraceae bacterium]
TNSSGDEIDTASSIAITCSPASQPPPPLYTVGGNVTQLPAGTSVMISDTVNGDSVMVSGPATLSAPVPFTLPSQLGSGAPYIVTASTAAPNICLVSNASGTIGNGNVTNITVACSASAGPPSALYGPRGIEFNNNLLFVPNYSTNQVLVLSEQTNTFNQVTGLTQVASIPPLHLNHPARAAFDASGNLYVANQGSQNAQGVEVQGTQSISVYDSSYAEITASGGGALISNVSFPKLAGPIGVAVDSTGNVYVANDPGDSISVFTGSPSIGFTEASFSPLKNDGAGTPFTTPFMIVDEKVLGVGEYVIVGLSRNPTSRILVYPAPLTATSIPIYDLAGVPGCTMPSDPSGIALSGTSLYIAGIDASEIFEYSASTLIGGGGNPCVAPVTTNGTDMSGVEGVAVDSFDNVFVANAGSLGGDITVYAGASFGPTEAPLYTYTPACFAAPSPKGGGAQSWDNQAYCAGFTGTAGTYTFDATLTFTTGSPIAGSSGPISNCNYQSTSTQPGSTTTASTGPTACTGSIDGSGNLTITDGNGNGFTGTFSSNGFAVTGTYNFTAFGPTPGTATGSFNGGEQ